MAKLDDSVVSHISINESREEASGPNVERDENKMGELLSGIEARERLLVAKQSQMQS